MHWASDLLHLPVWCQKKHVNGLLKSLGLTRLDAGESEPC
jgi:hypothetical protein